MNRKARAVWQGTGRDGTGHLTTDSGVLSSTPYSFKTRFENEKGTNPEELIAAAHASCFAMALSNILAEHGHAPESVKASARVHLRNVDGAPTIARIDLDVEARVADIDEAHFAEHADEAKAGCPVSRALAGVPEIELNARLA
jgi:lipoyl-dependent peroxiredoxin